MVFGRFPAGRAIRYIFFACTGQKRMPLLSLTRHSKELHGSMNFYTYSWILRTKTPENQLPQGIQPLAIALRLKSKLKQLLLQHEPKTATTRF